MLGSAWRFRTVLLQISATVARTVHQLVRSDARIGSYGDENAERHRHCWRL